MCTVLLPPGVNPTAVKYTSYHIISCIKCSLLKGQAPNTTHSHNRRTDLATLYGVTVNCLQHSPIKQTPLPLAPPAPPAVTRYAARRRAPDCQRWSKVLAVCKPRHHMQVSGQLHATNSQGPQQECTTWVRAELLNDFKDVKPTCVTTATELHLCSVQTHSILQIHNLTL
jgi:hypothetical protein